jgi:hypothetical protein
MLSWRWPHTNALPEERCFERLGMQPRNLLPGLAWTREWAQHAPGPKPFLLLLRHDANNEALD